MPLLDIGGSGLAGLLLIPAGPGDRRIGQTQYSRIGWFHLGSEEDFEHEPQQVVAGRHLVHLSWVRTS